MSFSTPADFKARYDLRILGDVVADNGTQVTGTGLDTDANLQCALDDACGEMLAALMAGGRYSRADLTSLTDESANYLKRIECDIALRLVVDRRTYGRPSETFDRVYSRATEHLKLLRSGENIFDLVAAQTASVPSVTGPTVVQLDNLNLPSRRAQGHLFPRVPNPYNR